MSPIGILLGEPEKAKPLPFKDILRVSELLSDRLKVLHEKRPYPYELRFDPKRAFDIHAALKAINATPNASVSRETLDEWTNELCGLRDQLGKWCAGLVTFRRTDEEPDDEDCWDDEIPF